MNFGEKARSVESKGEIYNPKEDGYAGKSFSHKFLISWVMS